MLLVLILPVALSCFNPCFSGTRARTGYPTNVPAFPAWFQSLFFWNSRPDALGAILDIASLTLVSILVFLELAPGLNGEIFDLPQGALFQSLFFWNSRPDVAGQVARVAGG